MCQGINSHYFHIIGDGHQPNSRGLYTHYKDSGFLLKGGMTIPNIATFDHGTHGAGKVLYTYNFTSIDSIDTFLHMTCCFHLGLAFCRIYTGFFAVVNLTNGSKVTFPIGK